MYGDTREMGEPLSAANRGEQIDASVALKRLPDRQPLRLGPGITGMLAPTQPLDAGERQQRRAVLHDGMIVGACAVPFEHREFRMMQRRALGIAEHAREL